MTQQLIINDTWQNYIKNIPDNSVDMVLTDPPYGTTNCKFDSEATDLTDWWKEINRICKYNAAVVIFAQLPYACDVINSNRKNYRYDWIWQKTAPCGVLNAKKMPLRAHELVLVFYKKLPTYNPIKRKGKPVPDKRSYTHSKCYGSTKETHSYANPTGERFPIDILTFQKDAERYNSFITNKHNHPTAKPMELIKYLITTYTNEGEMVLDTFAGCCPVARAAYMLGRNAICIEKDAEYVEWALEKYNKLVEEDVGARLSSPSAPNKLRRKRDWVNFPK